ncbi:nitroreductase family protein [Gymnodinialimonas hymeniacidonis]|uniref:nitroreductase family protein n=1 Tax=Gymnodinialimonas hymeniacidonis TaxID=3126508 RepID=UPI0034C6BE18
MTDSVSNTNENPLQASLDARFEDAPPTQMRPELETMARRGSCRHFTDKAVDPALLRTLSAIALSSPTKSDLQQRDIILLEDPDRRARLAALVGGQDWVAQAPMLAVFCGNNRRQRLLHEQANIPFANDHFDAVFNAACDAAIALGAFTSAADAIGLGTCPISAVRNEARAVADLLDLPDHVFPFAGLAIGWPKHPPRIAKRLPLSVTVHTDRYQETDLPEAIARYDADRAAAQPYRSQRFVETFGEADPYTWSEDKMRQYSQPERADFGAYIRSIGFKLD